MRSTQEIFDTVIQAGLYRPRDETFVAPRAVLDGEDWRKDITHDEYMCNSLYIAHRENVISYDEYLYTLSTIREYLCGWEALVSALGMSDLPCTFEYTLRVYKDWDSRPKVKTKLEWMMEGE